MSWSLLNLHINNLKFKAMCEYCEDDIIEDDKDFDYNDDDFDDDDNFDDDEDFEEYEDYEDIYNEVYGTNL
jgi:hypothetical protein